VTVTIDEQKFSKSEVIPSQYRHLIPNVAQSIAEKIREEMNKELGPE
jgi:hypothetical protein